LHLGVFVQGFLVVVGGGLEVEDDLLHGPGGGLGGLVLVGEVLDTSVEVCLQVSTPR
jgi:hypothetical protein